MLDVNWRRENITSLHGSVTGLWQCKQVNRDQNSYTGADQKGQRFNTLFDPVKQLHTGIQCIFATYLCGSVTEFYQVK